MTRIKRGLTRRRRHKKLLAQTKGHLGIRHSSFRRAHESLTHALWYSYLHRKKKKGDMRRLWNIKINAGARINGISYGQLIHGLKLGGVEVNRKMLAGIAIADPETFTSIVDTAKKNLPEFTT